MKFLFKCHSQKRSSHARKKRRVFSPKLKYKIVKEGLQLYVHISELCRHYEIYPVDYYRCKRNAEAAILNDFKKSKKKEIKLTAKNGKYWKKNM